MRSHVQTPANSATVAQENQERDPSSLRIRACVRACVCKWACLHMYLSRSLSLSLCACPSRPPARARGTDFVLRWCSMVARTAFLKSSSSMYSRCRCSSQHKGTARARVCVQRKPQLFPSTSTHTHTHTHTYTYMHTRKQGGLARTGMYGMLVLPSVVISSVGAHA